MVVTSVLIVVKEIQRQCSDQPGFVFRYFPLIAIHAQSQTDEAVEVAAQGNFWEMHGHILFQYQQALDNGSLVEYAVMVGLDIIKVLDYPYAYLNHDLIVQHWVRS